MIFKYLSKMILNVYLLTGLVYKPIKQMLYQLSIDNADNTMKNTDGALDEFEVFNRTLRSS